MNAEAYVEGVLLTLAPGTRRDHLGACGIAFPEEAWELYEEIYTSAPKEQVIGEIGDLLWYSALLCHLETISFPHLLPQTQTTPLLLPLDLLPLLGVHASALGKIIKRYLYHGHPELEHLRYHLGELLTVLSSLLAFYQASFSEAFERNTEKLQKKRYPQGFSTEASRNR